MNSGIVGSSKACFVIVVVDNHYNDKCSDRKIEKERNIKSKREK